MTKEENRNNDVEIKPRHQVSYWESENKERNQGAVLLTVGRSYVGNDVTHSTLLDRACARSYENLPKYRSYRVSNTAPRADLFKYTQSRTASQHSEELVLTTVASDKKAMDLLVSSCHWIYTIKARWHLTPSVIQNWQLFHDSAPFKQVWTGVIGNKKATERWAERVNKTTSTYHCFPSVAGGRSITNSSSPSVCSKRVSYKHTAAVTATASNTKVYKLHWIGLYSTTKIYIWKNIVIQSADNLWH